MSDTTLSAGKSLDSDHIDTLFYHVEQLRFGMLGIVGSRQHPQPMSHHLDRENQSIWFISSAEIPIWFRPSCPQALRISV